MKYQDQEKSKIQKRIEGVLPGAVLTGGVAMSTLALLTDKPNSDTVFWVGVWLAIFGAGSIISDYISKQKNQKQR